jgi:exosome complex component RRP46
MKTLLTATSLAVRDDTASSITVDPSPAEARSSKSIHVLGFTSDKELLLAESEGAFTVEEWKQILTIGQRICCQRLDAKADVDARMADAETPEPASIAAFMRSVMETKTAQDLHWK